MGWKEFWWLSSRNSFEFKRAPQWGSFKKEACLKRELADEAWGLLESLGKIGPSYNGSTRVSKTLSVGSIPTGPAIFWVEKGLFLTYTADSV